MRFFPIFMENEFRIFLETIFKSLPRGFFGGFPEIKPLDQSGPEKSASTSAAAASVPEQAAPRHVSQHDQPHHHLSDEEFMDYLREEAERLNAAFREAASRDIDPHARIEARTESDEYGDLRRTALVALEPMKLLSVEDGVEDGEFEI